MSIQLALTVKGSAEEIECARGAGFAGVEWAGAVTDAPATRKMLEDKGLRVAGLATDLRLDTWNSTDVLQAGRQAVETAAELNAAVVRVWGYEIGKGQGRGEAITRIGKRLAALGQMAADRVEGGTGLRIAVENGGFFVFSKDLWAICEVARENEGGNVGVAWDVVTGARAGEGPALSVPTLNSRLVLGRVWEGIEPDWTGFAGLSAGSERVKMFMERLRGIGFQGWVIYSPKWPASMNAEERAADAASAQKFLHECVHPAVVEKGKKAHPAAAV